MSIYGKFLVEFDPPAGNFTWKMRGVDELGSASTSVTLTCSFSSGDATTDILGFVETLKDRMDDELDGIGLTPRSFTTYGAVFPDTTKSLTFPWFSTGPTTSTQSFAHSTLVIAAGGYANSAILYWNYFFDSVTWTSCDSDILNILGFAQTETIATDTYVIASAYRPRYCWFPGVGTYGAYGGAGVTSDSGWVPVDAHSRIVSGGGNMRITGPSRMQYTRRLRFEAMKRAEALEMRHRGPIAFFDQWGTKVFRWYPDRDIGTVLTTGTQGDPGPTSYHTDDDCSYWRCALAGEPRLQGGGDPDWFTFTIELNGEPA